MYKGTLKVSWRYLFKQFWTAKTQEKNKKGTLLIYIVYVYISILSNK